MTVTAHDLAEYRILAGVSDEHLQLIADSSSEVRFGTDERILSTDEPADHFYLIRSGRVAIEIDAPGRTTIVIETISALDVVGVSWLLPPHRWTFDATALEAVTAIEVDAVALRAACEIDPALGYALYTRFAVLLHERLVATRIRALDLYGATTS
ncbi:MAG: cyclic nucleotide-binding domain-containing protein [Acidimicrobiia bacterium]|nr:cyclic nucleotide-binding domain-containing protein [Acidimicrobiia bacterium]